MDNSTVRLWALRLPIHRTFSGPVPDPATVRAATNQQRAKRRWFFFAGGNYLSLKCLAERLNTQRVVSPKTSRGLLKSLSDIYWQKRSG